MITARSSNVQAIPFVHCQQYEKNDRENTHERLLNQEILLTAGDEGQRVAATVWKRQHKPGIDKATPDKKGFIYVTIIGNSRLYTLRYMGERGIIDPTTYKLDDAGNRIPGSGKPFFALQAVVIEGDLTEAEIRRLMNDNTVVSLTELEVARCIVRDEKTLGSARAATVANFGNAMRVWPMRGKTLTDYNDWLAKLPSNYTEDQRIKAIQNYHCGDGNKGGRLRGKIQIVLYAFASTTACKLAYEDRLRGKQNWPSDNDVRAMYTAYNADVQNDDKGEVNPDNPGPLATEKWQEVLRAVEVARLEGTKPKSTAMRSQDQIRKDIGAFKSKSLKLANFHALNKLPGNLIEQIDEALAEAEKSFPGLNEKLTAIFDKKAELDKIGAVTDVVTPPTPADKIGAVTDVVTPPTPAGQPLDDSAAA